MQYDLHILYTLGFATENFKIWSAHIRASACVDILRGRSVGCSTPDLWRSTYRAVCTTKYVPCFKMSEIFLFRLYFECGHGNQTSGYSTDPLAEVLLRPLSVQFQPKMTTKMTTSSFYRVKAVVVDFPTCLMVVGFSISK